MTCLTITVLSQSATASLARLRNHAGWIDARHTKLGTVSIMQICFRFKVNTRKLDKGISDDYVLALWLWPRANHLPQSGFDKASLPQTVCHQLPQSWSSQIAMNLKVELDCAKSSDSTFIMCGKPTRERIYADLQCTFAHRSNFLHLLALFLRHNVHQQ